jgi:hypothetical protein
MNNFKITSAKYVARDGQNTSINANIDSETRHIPLDPANRHYQAIQEWVAEGNTIEDAD